MLISNVGAPSTLPALFVGLFGIAIGILSFCSGFFNWDRDGKWPATAFWNSILGQKWANRLSMLLGAIIAIAGIRVIIWALRL